MKLLCHKVWVPCKVTQSEPFYWCFYSLIQSHWTWKLIEFHFPRLPQLTDPEGLFWTCCQIKTCFSPPLSSVWTSVTWCWPSSAPATVCVETLLFSTTSSFLQSSSFLSWRRVFLSMWWGDYICTRHRNVTTECLKNLKKGDWTSSCCTQRPKGGDSQVFRL